MSLKTRASLLFFASFYSFIFIPLMPLWAQSIDLPEDTDLFAPVIQHQPLEETVQPGTPYKLKAKVTDNIGVTEVILYYRTQGQEQYSSVNMEPTGKGGYATEIPKEDIAEPGIEYYIQASDQAGNTSQRAFPFSPLTIHVVAAPKGKLKEGMALAPIPPALQKDEKILTDEILPPEKESFALSTEKPLEPKAVSEKKPWYKKWWVWTIALAVAGGAAAAAGGGGGGGGGGAGQPATGSATISGPVP